MDLSALPDTAFIHPQGDTAGRTELLLHQAVQRIHTLLSQAQDRAIFTPFDPADPQFTFEFNPDPRSETEILDHLEMLLKSSMNPGHPGWMGHMDPMPTTLSLIGDLAAAGVNNNLLSLEMSPLFSRLERSVIQSFAQQFGLGERADGVMVSGGSLANLQALALARNVAFDLADGGLTQLDRPPVLLASEVAHTSIQKAAMILGLGGSSVIPVYTDPDSRMRIDHLQHQIHKARFSGSAPFCVVATAGTTTTGNIDPLPQIAEICREQGLWLHVDAAYGGAIVLSDRHKHRLAGIEQADSITFNPQKWLYVAKTCAMVLFRDGSRLRSHFRIPAPYMNTAEEEINLGEISVQGTRHADVLKLWLSLQHLGLKGYAGLIDESYRLTEYFAAQLQQLDPIQMASTPEMNLICFRGLPDGIPETEQDRWNADLQAFLLDNYQIFFSTPIYRGQKWLRAVLLNPTIDEAILDRACQGIADFISARSLAPRLADS